MPDVSELIRYMASQVVDQPQEVRVSLRRGTELAYLIQVAPGEEGRVIGKQGRIIHAMRTLARAASDQKDRLQVDVATPR
ncbi:MAG: KH domain-containing protein [Deinococcaceae bacterium]